MSEEMVSTESSAGMSGDSGSLQSEMTGNFFDYDDGLGAVVDQNGDPFTKEDGKYYRSIDEYKSSFGKNGGAVNTTQKPLSNQSSQPAQPNAQAKNTIQPKQTAVQQNSFDSFYKKENGFDISSILSESPKFNETTYERVTNPPIQENQNNIQQQQSAPVDPKVADANTLKEFRESLENSALKPIERAFSQLSNYYAQSGVQMPQEVYNALNAEYSQLKTAIDEAINSKKEELFENRFKTERETASFAETERKSVENFTRVSTQYFPNLSADQSEAKLSKLIFGYSDSTGTFTRGYGADIVDHAFDLANNGKTFKTKEEWSNAYNKWWSGYASNPKNIAYVAQRAWDRFIASSIDGIRDGFRSTWEQEQREKLKQTQQNPYAARGGNVSQVDSAQAQLNSYFTPPGRNM